jgi:ATP-dependent Clp protease ATP-binding subunit ClpC
VIEASVSEANRLGHHYVGTEHLLLGLLAEDIGFADRALVRLGVTRTAVRAAIELQKEQLARRFV